MRDYFLDKCALIRRYDPSLDVEEQIEYLQLGLPLPMQQRMVGGCYRSLEDYRLALMKLERDVNRLGPSSEGARVHYATTLEEPSRPCSIERQATPYPPRDRSSSRDRDDYRGGSGFTRDRRDNSRQRDDSRGRRYNDYRDDYRRSDYRRDDYGRMDYRRRGDSRDRRDGSRGRRDDSRSRRDDYYRRDGSRGRADYRRGDSRDRRDDGRRDSSRGRDSSRDGRGNRDGRRGPSGDRGRGDSRWDGRDGSRPRQDASRDRQRSASRDRSDSKNGGQ